MPLLCLVLNFSVSKLPVYHCIARSFVLHACTLHLSIVGAWSQEPSGTWSIATIEVALRGGNGAGQQYDIERSLIQLTMKQNNAFALPCA